MYISSILNVILLTLRNLHFVWNTRDHSTHDVIHFSVVQRLWFAVICRQFFVVAVLNSSEKCQLRVEVERKFKDRQKIIRRKCEPVLMRWTKVSEKLAKLWFGYMVVLSKILRIHSILYDSSVKSVDRGNLHRTVLRLSLQLTTVVKWNWTLAGSFELSTRKKV